MDRPASPAIECCSPNVRYTDDYIEAKYVYETSDVRRSDTGGKILVTPRRTDYTFRTQRAVPRLGVMLVGWGGNNGSTVTAAVLANSKRLQWETKKGPQAANYFGSITQSTTVLLGSDEDDPGASVYVPFKDLLPMVDPNLLIFDGWDISGHNLAEAMKRAEVLDYNLQVQLVPFMETMKPRPSLYYPDFIAANQADRADNLIPGSDKWEHMEQIRRDIRDFKHSKSLDKVIVLWTANTERFCDVRDGLNDTADNLLESIRRSEAEVSPSTVFAVASILEGCCYINGSPQNTFVPGVIELAERHNVFIGGDDFKSGQTKLKSVLVDFLVNSGIKPRSIVSYNHLGNNDGQNLSAPKQFRSKEISKSCVVDDMVESNPLLYKPGEKPDHCIVIKYVPYVGDSKRAMDEYVSEIMMGGWSTIAIHNTCEDSLLASPIILDLIVIAEICQRISFRVGDDPEFQTFNSVLSLLSYLCKTPLVTAGTPVVNALFRQRACLENVFRACIGLPPINNMLLEHKHSSPIERVSRRVKAQTANDFENRGSKLANGTKQFNGSHVNGCHADGVYANGVHANGSHVNGSHVNGSHLNGSHVHGTDEYNTNGFTNGFSSSHK